MTVSARLDVRDPHPFGARGRRILIEQHLQQQLNGLRHLCVGLFIALVVSHLAIAAAPAGTVSLFGTAAPASVLATATGAARTTEATGPTETTTASEAVGTTEATTATEAARAARLFETTMPTAMPTTSPIALFPTQGLDDALEHFDEIFQLGSQAAVLVRRLLQALVRPALQMRFLRKVVAGRVRFSDVHGVAPLKTIEDDQ